MTPVETPKPKPVATTRPAAEQDGISIYFSPHGGCTEAVVDEITNAKTEIVVIAYRLTSIPILKALEAAQDRGVKVTVVLDRMQKSQKYSDATYLFNHKIPVWTDPQHAIAHNKVMLIDGATVITGSFNFSAAAEESNAENLVVIHGKDEIAKAYKRNAAEHLAHAEKYEGLTKPPAEADESSKPVPKK